MISKNTLIMLIISIIFGFDLFSSANYAEEKMEDFELTINPTRPSNSVQTIDIAENRRKNMNEMSKITQDSLNNPINKNQCLTVMIKVDSSID